MTFMHNQNGAIALAVNCFENALTAGGGEGTSGAVECSQDAQGRMSRKVSH